MDVRATIVSRRLSRVASEGAALGVPVPESRAVPLVPFPSSPGVICEIKRQSPSRGAIDPGLEPIELAKRYVAGGANSISVLTEEDHFHGSLADLIEIKRNYPYASILRKDFLTAVDDIEISYRAGADAVLLIASVLDSNELAELLRATRRTGMAALVEVHDRADIEKAAPLTPELVGCNARDLSTFSVDLLAPLELASLIDWRCAKVFESGIWSREDVEFARRGGFEAILVGESVVRNPNLVPELVSGMGTETEGDRFWSRIATARAERRPGPLTKICGLTQAEDVLLADSLGADLLGFVFADSPRQVTADFVQSLPETHGRKVAVVVTEPRGTVPQELLDLVSSGNIDAIQFHGEESPADCARSGVPYYRAIRVGASDDLDSASGYRCPRVLIDAKSRSARGGSGEAIAEELVLDAAGRMNLWLAGGLDPERILPVIRRFRPELVDASSGLELRPGVKDPDLLGRYFEQIRKAGADDEPVS